MLKKEALKAAKASKFGKIALSIAATALAGKTAVEKMYEKRTGKKPFTKRRKLVDKKMGGGMMKKPMMAKKGKAVMIVIGMKPKKKMGGVLMEATQKLKAQVKMGGGMMMRPNPVGMKAGKSVKVKCKIGRNKPTKMY